MVRLVFRPYTQVWRSICTSEPRRTSTRVSSGFILFKHSSPSFGSQHTRFNLELTPKSKSSHSVVPQSTMSPLTFITRPSFNTQTLACVLDSLVRVSRRVIWRRHQWPSSKWYLPGLNTIPKHCYLPQAFSHSPNEHWLEMPIPSGQSHSSFASPLTLQLFPFWQFHVLFDPLFKVLFIFPSRYLFAIGLLPLFSLRWNIPPTLGCNPKQPDSLSALGHHAQVSSTGFSPSLMHFSKWLGHRTLAVWLALQTTIHRGDYKSELFPLHSPLLGESLLFSFPPLSNMLKFSGYSCLAESKYVTHIHTHTF